LEWEEYLFTDDAVFMRMQLRDMITKAVYEVKNEQTAVEKYAKLNPDLVTMAGDSLIHCSGIQPVFRLINDFTDGKMGISQLLSKLFDLLLGNIESSWLCGENRR